MLWKVWAAVGAIVSGIVVATVPGGSESPLAYPIMLAALLVGVGATVVVALLSYGRDRHVERGSRLQEEFAPHQSARQFQRDREIVQRLLSLIREREIDWLRVESFGGPWRDGHVVPLREVAMFDASHSGIFDPELADAVGRLTNAARTFFGIYDHGTIVDPMMRDATWRMIGRHGPAGEAVGSAERDRIGSQTRLREAATEICESYDALSVVSRHKFPPDRSVLPSGRRR